jgi:hypothetical protein
MQAFSALAERNLAETVVSSYHFFIRFGVKREHERKPPRLLNAALTHLLWR